MEAMTLKTAAFREKLASVPVLKSGLSLMTGTMVTSGLGLVFWVLAANLYDPADFGVSTTAVYTMIMLADVACLGLRTGLVRYLPRAGARTSMTVLWSYGLVLVASSLTALAFLLGLQWWAPDLIELRNSGLMFIFFVASTAFWALFMLEDAVLVGFRKAPWVPIENSLFGVLKIILLFPFAKLSPTLGIFWAWTLPVFPIVLGINVFVAGVARSRSAVAEAAASSRSLLRDILSFSIADWLAAAARLAALGVIPLMVLAQLDKVEAGYFQASWLMAFTIFALSSNAAYALLAETSYEQTKLHRNSVHAGLLSLALTVPVILIGVIGAPLLLRIYGADYAANSATVLRILLVAAIPNVVHQIFVGRLRSQGRMVAVVTLETMLSVLVVLLAWLFLPRYGIDGVGLAWLIGLSALALYAGVSESLWWWAARIDTRFVRTVGSTLKRFRLRRPARGMDSRLDRVLVALGIKDSPVAWQSSGGDGQSAIIDLNDDQLVVEFARSADGAAELDRRRNTILDIRSDPRLADLYPVLPEVRAHDETSDEEFLACSHPVGPTALDLVQSGASAEAVCTTILERLRPLHETTSSHRMIDEETIDRWLEEPSATLATLGRASTGNIERLRQVLIDGFSGRLVDVGRVHGELALNNVIMSTEPLAVTGLLRWQQRAEMPLVIDRATLALSDLALRGDTELGEVVTNLLADPGPFDAHPAIAPDRDPSLSSRVVIILAWLSLVGRPQPARGTMSSDAFWLARNARPVLAALEPLVGIRS